MSDSDIRLILAKLQEAVADIKKELLAHSREQVSLRNAQYNMGESLELLQFKTDHLEDIIKEIEATQDEMIAEFYDVAEDISAVQICEKKNVNQCISMSKKKCVLRRRAAERRIQNAIDTYVKWCKDNVTVRSDDGSEHPVDDNEAIEFILFTIPRTEPVPKK